MARTINPHGWSNSTNIRGRIRLDGDLNINSCKGQSKAKRPILAAKKITLGEIEKNIEKSCIGRIWSNRKGWWEL